MNQPERVCRTGAVIIALVIAAGLTCTVAVPAYGHGGRMHDGETFSAFAALVKATRLYDRLIISGKLPVEWETGLKAVTIDTRKSGEKREYVVRFERDGGEPGSVYFFFDQHGEYSGSNFTGE